jgi:hypothetical protein
MAETAIYIDTKMRELDEGWSEDGAQGQPTVLRTVVVADLLSKRNNLQS